MSAVARTLFAALLLAGCSSNGPSSDETLEDASFLAFVDDNADGASFDDAPRELKFSDYFASNRSGTKLIMVNAAAGWCGPCMREAGGLSGFAAKYASRGVVVLTAVFQQDDGRAADAEFTRLWAETFQLSIPALVDSKFLTKKYFDVNTLPANMFVDANTGVILTKSTGVEPGDDPLAEYAAWIDHYVSE
jgi:thiol-disulfide isomerase/thioredoxin